MTAQDKYRKGFDPMLEGVRFVPRNDVAALRAAVDDNVCGIVVEPIQGEGGIYDCFAGVSAEPAASSPTSITRRWSSTKFSAAWDAPAVSSPSSTSA